MVSGRATRTGGADLAQHLGPVVGVRPKPGVLEHLSRHRDGTDSRTWCLLSRCKSAQPAHHRIAVTDSRKKGFLHGECHDLWHRQHGHRDR
jgi:hypothetical protein